MDTIVNGIEVQIPEGYFNIPEDWLVQTGDKIAMVSKHNSRPSCRIYTLSWISPDSSEVGQPKKYSGKVVIRKCL